MTKLLTVDEGMTDCAACPFAGALSDPDACRRYFRILIDIDCRKYDITTIKTANYENN